MPNAFLADAHTLYDELVATRRDLHMHPELGFQEFRTARIVAEKLESLGYEVISGVGKTGVVGILGGAQSGDCTVLLRFDMDALPIQEENDVPYCSQVPGVMHACGHDAHVAVGLGVATLLARHRDRFGGTIKLMFQPAEEGLGGARAMIADGVLKSPDVDVALALHVTSGLNTGLAIVRSGALLAAADDLHIIVHGHGGHAAQPEQTVDAVLVASHIVVALQSIVSRNISPEETGVVTVGSFHAGNASNVIAETAELRGSIRCFSPEIRSTLHQRIRDVANGIASALGATVEVSIISLVDPTINAPKPTALVHQVASEVLGEEHIVTTFRTTGGEDFSAVLVEVPGQFFFLGARDIERGLHYPHHNPRFDIDETCLPHGVAILCESAVRLLNDRSHH